MIKGWAIKGLVAGVAAVGASAVAIPTLNGLSRGPDVPVYRVERGAFKRTVVAEGILEAEKTTPLTAPTDARQQLTVAWLAPDGSRVKADEIVVRFDPTEMQQNLLDGESEKDTALSRMSKKELESGAVFENLKRDEDMAARELEYAREFQKLKAASDAKLMRDLKKGLDQQIDDSDVDLDEEANHALYDLIMEDIDQF